MSRSARRRWLPLQTTMLAAILLAGTAQAGGRDPNAVLDDIFSQVTAMCGGDGQGPAYDLEAIARKYFDPALIAIVTRDDEQPGALGFDVLIDGQDCKTSELKLAIVGGGTASAIGRATFKNMGEDRIIDLQMKESGGDWTASDIVYKHRSFSLKAQ